MSAQADYFEYLKGRSRLGQWYRFHWLYPKLCRYLHGRVLDVGCGIGDMLRYRPNTVGVDINPSIVAWCCSQGLDSMLMEPDCLPFADVEFDGAILDNVLEHLKNPQPLLAEIRRVLPEGGTLLVGVPGKRGYDSDPDHKVFYGEVELAAEVARAGFTCQRIFHMPVRMMVLEKHMSQYCIYGVFRCDG